MDALYSGTLLASFVCSGAGLLLVWQRLRRSLPPPDVRHALILVLGTLALLLATLSTAVHFVLGHGIDSPEPLRGAAFLNEHRGNVVALLLAIVPAIAGVVLPRRR